MEKERFQETCFQEKEKKWNIQQPFCGTCIADFMMRQGAGNFMLGTYLSHKQIPWRRRRRLGMAVAKITPIASQLTKIGKMQSAGCQQCRRARKARGEITDNLTVETYSHINSVSCEGIATTITAARHSTSAPVWQHACCTQVKSKLKLVTHDKESDMSREKFLRICSEFAARKV